MKYSYAMEMKLRRQDVMHHTIGKSKKMLNGANYGIVNDCANSTL